MYFRTILILSGPLLNSFLSIGNGITNSYLTPIQILVDTNKPQKEYLPDSSINKTIFLCNPLSVIRNFGDLMNRASKNADMGSDIEKEDLPNITFLNKGKNQYFKMLFHPGDTKNSFSEFEIGYIKDRVIKKSKQSNFISFETESGVQLGITLQELIDKKGKGYTIGTNAGITCVSYVLNDIQKSSFLKRYNMPVYYAKYYLQENKVVMFTFGFEYP